MSAGSYCAATCGRCQAGASTDAGKSTACCLPDTYSCDEGWPAGHSCESGADFGRLLQLQPELVCLVAVAGVDVAAAPNTTTAAPACGEEEPGDAHKHRPAHA